MLGNHVDFHARHSAAPRRWTPAVYVGVDAAAGRHQDLPLQVGQGAAFAPASESKAALPLRGGERPTLP
eukprot:5219404-Prymnesium_polylepis.1